jgi:hypothetical protein
MAMTGAWFSWMNEVTKGFGIPLLTFYSALRA